MHVRSVHVTVEPVHDPAPLHVVLYVHRLPSSHEDPLGYDTAQLTVPLHARSTQSELVQVMSVPSHTSLPLHTSLYEQRLPSSQPVPKRHCQIPNTFVHRYTVPPHVTRWHDVCVVSLHTAVEPPPHAPFAPFSPHPTHVFA
jgi:hypothetical protein